MRIESFQYKEAKCPPKILKASFTLACHYSERDSGHDLAFTGEGLIAEQSEAGATLFCIPQSER
jgi:hypothetical protein